LRQFAYMGIDMTKKLYYEDAYATEFDAVVLSCEEKEMSVKTEAGEEKITVYQVILNQTLFFPEEGGQSPDKGVLGGANVLDVQVKNNIITHSLDKPLEVGTTVYGTLDWKHRFSNMQQHSGEHIFSGTINRLYGYNNVGFHLSDNIVTMDFNGVLTEEDVASVEYLVNEAIIKNLPITVTYPSKEELSVLEYRSKIEIEGQVRIVTVEGVDVCACCAPHVKKTGEIGIIKLVGVQNYKGGVRVSMLCGFRALADYEEKSESVKTISVMLSAKEKEIAGEVSRLKEEAESQKTKIAELQREILTYKVKELEDNQEIVIVFEPELTGSAPRELMNLILAKGTTVAFVFSGNSLEGYRYVIGSRTQDTRIYAKALNEKFHGRGGGKPEMVQGSLCGNEMEIREEVMLCKERVLEN